MAIIKTNQLTFSYPETNKPAVDRLNLEIQPGEWVVIGGSSGSGKSTLLRLLKKDISPHGYLTGEIYYKDRPFMSLSPIEHAKTFGFVFQDPENQLVMERVQEELIFGLENMGVSTAEMRRKVAEMVHALGLEPLLPNKTIELSGGQKQLLNLASVLLLEPSVLLLDEPTAQLDPVTAKEFLQLVEQMNREFGLTVVMVEHRLEEVLPLADRFVLMNEGRILYNGAPRAVLEELKKAADDRYMTYLPSLARLYLTFSNESSALSPLTVKEGREWLSQLTVVLEKKEEIQPAAKFSQTNQPLILETRRLDFKYSRESALVLDGLELSVKQGDIFAILGANGAGKSTLLKVLAGLVQPQAGSLKYKGKKIKGHSKPLFGYLPQNTKLFFIHDTVMKELQSIVQQHGIENGQELIHFYLDKYELQAVKDKHPYDLSGGEQQRVALIGSLLWQPEILLFDEPTKGMDPFMKKQLGEEFWQLKEEGRTLVIVTHDIEFAAKYATDCAMLFQGKLTAEGPPESFFKGNTFYTTAINRLTRNHEQLPEVVTVEEAEKRWIACPDC